MMRLRLIKYTLEGKPYTAFIAMTDSEFSDALADDECNLAPYEKQIIRVVETYEPSEIELASAREAFRRFYTDAKGPTT